MFKMGYLNFELLSISTAVTFIIIGFGSFIKIGDGARTGSSGMSPRAYTPPFIPGLILNQRKPNCRHERIVYADLDGNKCRRQADGSLRSKGNAVRCVPEKRARVVTRQTQNLKEGHGNGNGNETNETLTMTEVTVECVCTWTEDCQHVTSGVDRIVDNMAQFYIPLFLSLFFIRFTRFFQRFIVVI